MSGTRRRVVTTVLAISALWFGVQGTASAQPETLRLEDEYQPREGEPGSGESLKKALRPPDPERLAAPLPVRPRDEAEVKGIAEIERIYHRYRDAHEATANTAENMLVISAVQAKRKLEARYEEEMKSHAAEARKMRVQAVKRYRAFLDQHPDHPLWTPEILFRLAELQFESSAERFARQEEAYEKELAAHQERLEKDPEAEPPPAPRVDHSESIAGFRRVIDGFPDYRYGDAALYMMATLLFEEEQFDQSRQAYLALACKNQFDPPAQDGSNVVASKDIRKNTYASCEPWRSGSKFADEAWLRVGESHYDFDELELALEAYERVANDPEKEFYDEALIRLAWTLYLQRRFPEAAKRFDEFIVFADTQRGRGEVKGAVQLRDDAVRYLAKTYVEEDWNLDGRRDRPWGVERLDRDYRERGKERHVPEVYAALGDLFAEQTDYRRAINIWTGTLSRWPLAAAAPKIQLRVLQAHNMLQDTEGARVARDRLATNYLRGTQWFYANETDPEVIEEAMKLAEQALVATAIDHHQRAQTMRAQGDPRARDEYIIASKAYRAYLDRFPDTPSSYEYRYNFAESLYYSDQFIQAAEEYANVRDSNLDNRLQEDAASGSVDAYEAHVEKAKADGKLVYPDLPKKGDPGPFDTPKQIPEDVLALQASYDAYAVVMPDSAKTATMKYLAGEVSQRYFHFDDAERRFVAVLEEHCGDNVSINAGKAIIDAHVVREDLEGTREWTDKLMGMKCGAGDAGDKFAGELKTIGNAVRFQEASLLLEAGEFEAAADRYVALVDQAPDDPNADRALNNAAYAYEKIGRFGSASKTYRRIYTDYPDSEIADNALQRTAFNHVRFFEFDEAVQAYLVLAQDQRYQDSEFQQDALWNAADLLDNLQDYKQSSALFSRYAAESTDPEKAAEAAFRAATVTEKTGDQRATIKAYQGFLGQYGADETQSARTVEAHLRIGKAEAARGRRSRAEASYRQVVSLFGARGLQPASDSAGFPAEAQFLLAEYAMADYLELKIKGTGKKLEKDTKALLDKMVVASEEYAKVLEYRNIDWALAAVYRTGYAFESTGIKLREAPVPKKLKEYSAPWFAYRDIVDAAAQRFEGKAIDFYQQTLNRGKEYGIANEWTRAATERLNIYRPDDFPLLRRPALDLQLEDRR